MALNGSAFVGSPSVTRSSSVTCVRKPGPAHSDPVFTVHKCGSFFGSTSVHEVPSRSLGPSQGRDGRTDALGIGHVAWGW